ncbi:MAG: MFS transporter, partial [Desulfobacterales bacterium]|nr:MFS transporter [Desulfobacterales bacterium]
FSEKKNVSGFGFMMGAQGVAKLISSLVILKLVEQFGFSTLSAAYIFLSAGLLFLVGSYCFLFTKEISDDKKVYKNSESFSRHTKSTIKEILENKNFLKYLIGDLDYYIVITTISFYAIYATQFFSIKASTAAGLFVCIYYVGSIVANLLFGPFDFIEFMDLKKKFVSTKILTLTGLFILIFFPTLSGFLFASLLFGLCRGLRNIIFSPSVKMFANKEDTTGYFAVAPLFTIIFGSGLPIFYGTMLDMFSSMQVNAYKMMFGMSIFLTSIILYFSIITDFTKPSTNEEYVQCKTTLKRK